jgi:hypothetical protein
MVMLAEQYGASTNKAVQAINVDFALLMMLSLFIGSRDPRPRVPGGFSI